MISPTHSGRGSSRLRLLVAVIGDGGVDRMGQGPPLQRPRQPPPGGGHGVGPPLRDGPERRRHRHPLLLGVLLVAGGGLPPQQLPPVARGQGQLAAPQAAPAERGPELASRAVLGPEEGPDGRGAVAADPAGQELGPEPLRGPPRGGGAQRGGAGPAAAGLAAPADTSAMDSLQPQLRRARSEQGIVSEALG